MDDLDWLRETALDYRIARDVLNGLEDLEPGEYTYRLHKWKFRRDLAIAEAYRQGYSVVKITEACGLSSASQDVVYNVLDTYDIPRRKKKD